MFLGEYKHTVDVKGRIAIPAKFRTKIGAGAIITRGLDKCLFVFEAKEWQKMAEKLISLPISQANSRAFARLMLSGATDVELDTQGRILIPDYLKQFAGIQKQAVVTGVFNRLEIWDVENWRQYKTRTETESDEIAEKLGELGI